MIFIKKASEIYQLGELFAFFRPEFYTFEASRFCKPPQAAAKNGAFFST
jgi:hypothetical protein